jgi:hypothetical protein
MTRFKGLSLVVVARLLPKETRMGGHSDMMVEMQTKKWNSLYNRGGGDGGFGAPRFKQGEWHHLTGVVALDKLLLYVDGEFLKEMPYAGPMASDGPETEIGHAQDGGFIGLIDEVAIYDRALSSDEIQQNFHAQGLAVNPTAVHPAGKLATRWGEIKVSR